MPSTHTLVIGGGQAGLATSRCLTTAGVDHVVLERGRTAERWRSERWDSLRLLTPNWASRLPDWHYRGPDPDGFMTGRRARRPPRRLRPVVRRADRARPRRSSPSPSTTTGSPCPTRRRRGRRATSSSPPAGATRRTSRRSPTGLRPLDRAAHAGRPTATRHDLPDGGRPRRRCIRHGCAAGRRAGAGRARRRARRRSPQPGPAPLPGHGHLVVVRAARHVRADDRRRRRPAPGARARAPCSSSGTPDRRDVDLPVARRAAACSSSAGWPGSTATRARLRPRPRAARRGTPTQRLRPACSARSTTTSPATGLEREVLDPERPAACWPRRRDRPARWTSGDGACAPSSGPPATAGPTRGCGPGARRRRRDRPAARRSPPSPASTSSACASSTAATPTSSTASATTPGSSPDHIASRRTPSALH